MKLSVKHLFTLLVPFLVIPMASAWADVSYQQADESSPYAPATISPQSAAPRGVQDDVIIQGPIVTKARQKPVAPKISTPEMKSITPEKLLASIPDTDMLKLEQPTSAPKFKYQFTMRPGYLHANLKRFAKKRHWNLVWTLGNEDYRVYGSYTLKASSFKGLVQKIFTGYPLHAALYRANRVIVVKQ